MSCFKGYARGTRKHSMGWTRSFASYESWEESEAKQGTGMLLTHSNVFSRRAMGRKAQVEESTGPTFREQSRILTKS